MTAERSNRYLLSLFHELRKIPHETEWVEFKHNNDNPDEIGEYLSALANSAALLGKVMRTWYGVWITVPMRSSARLSGQPGQKSATRNWKAGCCAFYRPKSIFASMNCRWMFSRSSCVKSVRHSVIRSDSKTRSLFELAPTRRNSRIFRKKSVNYGGFSIRLPLSEELQPSISAVTRYSDFSITLPILISWSCPCPMAGPPFWTH